MKSGTIRTVKALQILDCRGRPAVEAEVVTAGGLTGRGTAPTGCSVGMHEAYVLRDEDPSSFRGMSVFKAIDNINKIIAPALVGMDVSDQAGIDERMIELDCTRNKSNLGGNAIYSVSAASLRAAAALSGTSVYRYLSKKGLQTVPVPIYNCINGGRYRGFTLPFQEYSAVPYKARTMAEAVEIGVLIFAAIGEVVQEQLKGNPPSIGNYWGWAPLTDDPRDSLALIVEAAKRCGVADKIALALDCACSEMYNPDRDTYNYRGKEVDTEDMIEIIEALTREYEILFVEDPLQENDWAGWQKARAAMGRTNLLGDDLTVTSLEKLRQGYEMGAIEGFIFKPNQVGTITEALRAHQYARENRLLTIPSIRAGGIVDDIVMDLAVAVEACATKQGSPHTGERTYFLNFLLRAAAENPQAVPYNLRPYAKF